MVIFMAKKLVIMPPSFRRRKSDEPLPAIEMYNGVLYQVLRANMPREKIVDVVILTEDLELIPANKRISYRPPKGERKWSGIKFEVSEDVIKKNLEFLKELFEKGDYDEVFVALGRNWRRAIQGIEELAKEKRLKVVYITGRGLGPYEAALKRWLRSLGEGGNGKD